jgi:enoyl-CoA hydratase/carnithine racemase
MLNAPERRNAISYAMRDELSACVGALDQDAAVVVVVVTGAGSTFCAGVDLTDGAPQEVGAHYATQPLTSPLDQLSKPLIAAINGPAIGGGFEIALAADVRVATTNAWFALPEVQIGSLPGSGGTQRLARALPSAVAAELLFTGDRLPADDAYRYGLVTAVVAPEELESRTRDLAERIAANAPLSIRAAKLALRAAVDHPLVQGRALERALWAMLATTEDRAEGRAAFREGRKPDFNGR